MDLDAEFGQLEQALLQLIGGSIEVEHEMGQRVQHVQIGFASPTRLGDVLSFQRGDLVQNELSFRVHVVVALPQPLGEWIVGVCVLGLPEHVVLPASQVSGTALQSLAPLGSFLADPLLGVVHVSGQ